jgi:hypothetical protein
MIGALRGNREGPGHARPTLSLNCANHAHPSRSQPTVVPAVRTHVYSGTKEVVVTGWLPGWLTGQVDVPASGYLPTRADIVGTPFSWHQHAGQDSDGACRRRDPRLTKTFGRRCITLADSKRNCLVSSDRSDNAEDVSKYSVDLVQYGGNHVEWSFRDA